MPILGLKSQTLHHFTFEFVCCFTGGSLDRASRMMVSSNDFLVSVFLCCLVLPAAFWWPPFPLGWSPLVSWSSCCSLVPPSGYLLLMATAWLPCPCAWSVVAHCFPSSLCLMAAKVFGPVWGFFPLHHVTRVVGVLCAPSLRHSSAHDPCPLLGSR